MKDGDKIAFMGDSITEFGNYTNAYIDLTIDGLARAGVKATKIPAGVSGNVAEQMAARFDRDVVGKKPNWVTIMAGVNDASRFTVEQYMGYIRTMVEKAVAAGITPVLVSPTIVDEVNWASTGSTKKLDDYTEALKALASEKGIPFVDVHADFMAELRKMGHVGHFVLTCDNCHMSSLGNEIIACGILKAFGVDAETIAAAQKAWRDYPRCERLSVQTVKPTAAECVAWMVNRVDEIQTAYPKATVVLSAQHHYGPKSDEVNRILRGWADGRTVFWCEGANSQIGRTERQAAHELTAAPGKKPVFINYDDTHFFHTRGRLGMDVGEEEIRDLVRKYRGTDVTDFVLCANGRIADVPNKSKQCWLDKYDQLRENGEDVCYTNHPVVWMAKRIWRDKKLDPYALWIDEARECGFRPWLSFRMNDCHGSPDKTSFLHPDFYHDHPEYRRVRNRPRAGWFDIGYDWSFAAVRERELGYIVEMMERYEMEGVELDWLREAYCFVPGREDAKVITDFMRQVRTAADRIGEKRGKRIRLMARVPEDPEVAFSLGFDAATWAHEGLVDVLVPAPRWRTADVNVPVELWHRLVYGTDVKVVPGWESLLSECRKNFLCLTPEQLVGIVAVNYARGADGVYAYNMFDDPCWNVPEKRWICSGSQPTETLVAFWPNQRKLLEMLGSPEKVAAAPRDHVLTFRDLKPEWERTSLEPEWNTADEPFPTKVGPETTRYFRIPTGPVAPDRSLVVRIGIDTPDPALPKVFVNGRATNFLRTEACVPAHTKAPLCVFEVNAKEYAEKAAVVEVLAEKPLDLSYMDVIVR